MTTLENKMLLKLPPNLKTLNLHSNRITDLPENFLISQYNLETLTLNQNCLFRLPKKIKAPKLETLKLHQNKLKYLPENFGQYLCKLSNLNLSRNEITQLPKTFYKLSSLENLVLQLVRYLIFYFFVIVGLQLFQ